MSLVEFYADQVLVFTAWNSTVLPADGHHTYALK